MKTSTDKSIRTNAAFALSLVGLLLPIGCSMPVESSGEPTAEALTLEDRSPEEAAEIAQAAPELMYVDAHGFEMDPSEVALDPVSSPRYENTMRLNVASAAAIGQLWTTSGGQCSPGKTRAYFSWTKRFGGFGCLPATWYSDDVTDCRVKTFMQGPATHGECELKIYEH